jgi:DNA-binding protein HU-beta
MASKQELIKAVAVKAEISKKEAGLAVSAVFDTITEELAKGEKVQIIGFGTFETRERAARTGRNPQTGEELKIAATRVAKWKPGQNVKKAVIGK